MAEKSQPSGASDEPSIEEILGSIRRIIAEDDDTVPDNTVADAVLADTFDEQEEEEPLELTQRIDADGTIVSQHAAEEDFSEEQTPAAQEFVTEEAPEDAPQPVQAENMDASDAYVPEETIAFVEEEAPAMSDTDPVTEELVSEATAQAAAAVMAKLARRSAVTEEGGAEGITLEAIVREMLKPMLREWLDTNLPDIVEKVVEREMERLSKRV